LKAVCPKGGDTVGLADSRGDFMADYAPASRRPISDIFRRTAHPAVRFCVRRGIHPDVVSYASIGAAAAAALCFWQAQAVPALLIAGVGFCYLRLWFNMLDGMVALAAGKASPAGEIVNELPDRVSDVIIFVGVGHSGLCHPFGGYWVAIFALRQKRGHTRFFSSASQKQPCMSLFAR